MTDHDDVFGPEPGGEHVRVSLFLNSALDFAKDSYLAAGEIVSKGGPEDMALAAAVRAVRAALDAMEQMAAREHGEAYARGVYHEPAIPDVPQNRKGRKMPVGHILKMDFAELVNVTPSEISKLIDRGMPVASDGTIPVIDAMAWFRADSGAHAGLETKSEFGRRLGVEQTTVGRMIKRGMPAIDGRVDVKRGLEWLEENPLKIFAGRAPGDGVQTMTRSAFEKELGIARGLTRRAIARGFPINENGLVIVDQAKEWIRKNPFPPVSTKPPVGSADGEYETQHQFAARIKIGGGKSPLARLKAAGLPSADNGWIPVQRGLEWVREHRPDLLK